jgi:hypothetical protein
MQTPIAEYYNLRGAPVDSSTAVPVPSAATAPGGVAVLSLPNGAGAFDIELNVTIPPADGGMVQLGLACNTDNCGLYISFDMTPVSASGARTVTMSVATGQKCQTTFPLLASESALPVRVMTDTGSVEIFAGNGRGVYSAGMPHWSCNGGGNKECAVTAMAVGALKSAHVTATAWPLGLITTEGF